MGPCCKFQFLFLDEMFSHPNLTLSLWLTLFVPESSRSVNSTLYTWKTELMSVIIDYHLWTVLPRSSLGLILMINQYYKLPNFYVNLKVLPHLLCKFSAHNAQPPVVKCAVNGIFYRMFFWCKSLFLWLPTNRGLNSKQPVWCQWHLKVEKLCIKFMTAFKVMVVETKFIFPKYD